MCAARSEYILGGSFLVAPLPKLGEEVESPLVAERTSEPKLGTEVTVKP